jgi:Na+/H+ antiporter NhaD/arsenite permease-like protein
MLMAAGILIFTFVGIFTETFHSIERAKFAMAGAIMVAGQGFGFYSPELALQAIAWNVVFLLAIMMIIVSIMISNGGFEWLAGYLAAKSGSSQLKLMVLLGTAVTVISLLLDNVTTVIIFGPLIVLICHSIANSVSVGGGAIVSVYR